MGALCNLIFNMAITPSARDPKCVAVERMQKQLSPTVAEAIRNTTIKPVNLSTIISVSLPPPSEKKKKKPTGSASSEDARKLAGESSPPHSSGTYRKSPNAVNGVSGVGGDGDGVGGAMRRDGGEVPGSSSSSSRFSAASVALGYDRDLADDDDDERERDDAHTREMTRKWLQRFTAEDILRDKTLMRQQLEVMWPGEGGIGVP